MPSPRRSRTPRPGENFVVNIYFEHRGGAAALNRGGLNNIHRKGHGSNKNLIVLVTRSAFAGARTRTEEITRLHSDKVGIFPPLRSGQVSTGNYWGKVGITATSSHATHPQNQT